VKIVSSVIVNEKLERRERLVLLEKLRKGTEPWMLGDVTAQEAMIRGYFFTFKAFKPFLSIL